MSKKHCSFLLLILLVALSCGVATSQASETFEAAGQLYETQRWAQAALAFEHLAQDQSLQSVQQQTARLYVGECLMQLGQYEQAKEHYELVEQSKLPTKLAAQAHFRLGEVAWLTGEVTSAAQQLQTYLEKYPQGTSVAYANKYLAEIRSHQSAQQDFAVLDQAVGWQREGRHAAALSAYHKLLQQPLAEPIRAETLRRAAMLHDSLAQLRESLNLYEKFLAEFPNSKRGAEVMLAVARLHERLDQPAQAVEQFRGVYSKFFQSAQAAEAAYWLARSNADDKESDQSMQYVDWLLSQEMLSEDRPQLWAKTLCLKCQLISDQGLWRQVDELVGSTRDQVVHEAAQNKLDFWAAEAAFRLRKYTLAKQRYEDLQPRILGTTEPWAGMVPLRRAQLAARKQLWGQVLKILDQFERDFPSFELNHEIDYLRGRAFAGRGEMTAARRHYEQVLANPAANDTETMAMAGWMIGETYFHQRDYPRARLAYEKVIAETKLSDWQSRAALQAGKCWELENDWEQALSVYRQALQRWPTSGPNEQLESRLRWAKRQSSKQNQPTKRR